MHNIVHVLVQPHTLLNGTISYPAQPFLRLCYTKVLVSAIRLAVNDRGDQHFPVSRGHLAPLRLFRAGSFLYGSPLAMSDRCYTIHFQLATTFFDLTKLFAFLCVYLRQTADSTLPAL